MKFALVTGSSSGLGLEITKSLLYSGYTVFGGSRSGTDVEHENFYDVELDIASEESVEEFFETIREFTDQVHLVVNNAGICEMSPVAEMSVENFENHLAINTVGPFLLFQGLESFLVKNETHIISILSTAAHYGYPMLLSSDNLV
jgi:NAD(P)-dependent dehydrogenase (short-subunit alcohol dehydrogenase family)